MRPSHINYFLCINFNGIPLKCQDGFFSDDHSQSGPVAFQIILNLFDHMGGRAVARHAAATGGASDRRYRRMGAPLPALPIAIFLI
jgi:hypothetical protein